MLAPLHVFSWATLLVTAVIGVSISTAVMSSPLVMLCLTKLFSPNVMDDEPVLPIDHAAKRRRVTNAARSPCHDGIPVPSSPPAVTPADTTSDSPKSTSAPLAGAPASLPHASPSSASAPATPPPPPGHRMVTHARAGIFKPNPRYAMNAETDISPLPKTARKALRDPNWRRAMEAEFTALQANRIW